MHENWQEALEAARDVAATAEAVARLSSAFGGPVARWAFNQWRLRERARRKFDSAEEMLFTGEALEQASAFAIARYHASLFPHGELVADLTCGIGGDLMAFAERGPVLGYEIDPERAEYARHNCKSARVLEENSLQASWPFEYAFADPSRRSRGERIANVEEWEPNPHELAERMANLKLGCMKLSPLIGDDELRLFGPSVRFISYAGECREALVCTGMLAEPAWQSVHVDSGEILEYEAGQAERTDIPAAFVFDADPAAVRAHVLPVLCRTYALELLGTAAGYLTGREPAKSVWLRRYAVLDFGHFDVKRVKQSMRKHDIGRVEIKKRGVDIEPARLQKQLSIDAPGSGVLILYPVGQSVRYALTT